MEWNAITSVTTGLTLVAFVTAALATVFRRRVKQTEVLIRSAPAKDRAQLVDHVIDAVHVNTSDLTREQRFELARTILDTRAENLRATRQITLWFGVIVGLLTLVAIWPKRETHESKSSATGAVTNTITEPSSTITSDIGNVSTLTATTASTDAGKPHPTSSRIELKFDASMINRGGYVTYDSQQQMIVSATPAGGPSENFSIEVDLPRAGTYTLTAMWASAVQTEVYVYTRPIVKDCASPNLTMDDAALHYLPPITGGWSNKNLPNYPDHVGNLLLPRGKSTITFTSRSCGGGLGNGRLPSTAWVRLTEV